MTDRYSYARRRVAAKLKEFSIGTVTLTRKTLVDPDPETPWIPGEPTTEVFSLDARVDGVAAQYVDNAEIKATDRMAIVSPKATNEDGDVVDIVPQMSDVFTIDGADVVVKKIEAVPAAGPAARFHVFIAS